MKLEQAFNAGVGLVSESLKPVKESLVSILQLGQDNGEVGKDESDTEHVSVHEPSTPQLKCGTPFMDGNCLQEKANFSTQKQSRDQYAESKSVETTFDDSTAETLPGEKSDLQSVEGGLIKVKDNSGDNNSKIESSMSPLVQAKNDSHDCADNTVRFSGTQNSTRKTNKKKLKIDWTPDLHKKFVQAVEQLGAGQVIPSRILELMKVEGLTRHNVASHLQKYRMNRRHILSKEDERRCPQNKDAALKNYYPNRPIMAFPPYHSHHISYPVWGLQGNHQHPMQYWSPPLQPAENWQWKPYPALHADAWGCPVVPAFQGMGFPFPQDGSGYHTAGAVDNASEQSSFRLHPILNFKTVMQAEEVVDRVVKEAISKPWLPLPLGLKSPPTDGVLAELSRQGIIPCIPHQHGDLELDPH
ncbi:hypothetical protein SAY86_021616 [Trapa natans]|uniref:HTH myb-type domain-containing protein n=1 Tax=Trapa natans TaxID=22666 RepID=A0AAN7M908_TRANT|nr:hypothetical protein SAY86_021616 [Trapa natans]